MERRTMRLASGLAVAGAVVVTAACSDARLEKLSTGISRDSALAVINEGRLSRPMQVVGADIEEIGLLMGGIHGEAPTAPTTDAELELAHAH